MHDTADSALPTFSSASGLSSALDRPGTGRPARRAVRLLLAPLLYLLRRPGQALAVFALLALIILGIATFGLFFWSDYHLRAARRAVEFGHDAIAIRHLQAYRRVRPSYPDALLLAARVARRQHVWNEAESLLDAYWQQRGDDEDLVLERLCLRAARGEVEAVGYLLQVRIVEDTPMAPLAREALIAGLLYRFRLPEAGKQIDDWLQAEPDNALAWFAQGRWNESREQDSEAVNSFRRVLEIDPEHDEARLRMTTHLLELHQGGEALTHLEYLRRRLPGSPEVLMQLAQALDLQDRDAEARDVLDECLRQHADHAGALAERGRIASRDGEDDKAEDYLRRATRLDPSNPTSRYQFYLILNKNGKKAEAERELDARRRIEADIQRIKDILNGPYKKAPNDPDLHYEVAMILMRAGRPNEMLRWLNSAIQVAPDHVRTHRFLAAYYHETGNPILSARHRALAGRLDSQPKK
jgi:tetratricopeptide (TPR) repeat protein